MLNNIIDISHYQTVASFQEVKNNGIVGVIHKATQGRTMVDAKYHARRHRALDAGLLWGAYHFGTRADVEQQVDHFLNTTNPTATDLLVLDFEPNPIGESGTMTLSQAERFVALVNERIGRFPGLYSGQSFIREKVGNRTTTLSNCFLWIARYSSNLPIVPPAWKTFTFWQYTDGNAGDQPHQVPGIGRCDRNKFNGSLTGLRRLWGVNDEILTARSFDGTVMMAAAADATEMTREQCEIWINGAVRQRTRDAVERWCGKQVVSTDKLGEIAPNVWSRNEQNSLISVTNNLIEPIFSPDNSQMKSLSTLLSADTTVKQWEGIVWDNQEPDTFCRRRYNL